MEVNHLPDVQYIWNIWPYTWLPVFWLVPRTLLNIIIFPIYLVVWWVPILWNFIFEELTRLAWYGSAWLVIGFGQTWMLLNPFYFPIYWSEWLFVYIIDWNVTTF